MYTTSTLRANFLTLVGRALAWATRCERVYLGPYPGWWTYQSDRWPWAWLRWLGFRAITLGEVTVFRESPTGGLLRHELAHVAQYRRLGWRFPFAYAWGCVVGLVRAIHAHHPLEEEAREAERW